MNEVSITLVEYASTFILSGVFGAGLTWLVMHSRMTTFGADRFEDGYEAAMNDMEHGSLANIVTIVDEAPDWSPPFDWRDDPYLGVR